MKKTDNAFMNDKLQASALKLISEEYLAYQLYTLAGIAVKKEEAPILKGLFGEIAEDELHDHLKELVEWCRQYGYEIPCTETEFKKYADKNASKQVSQLRKGQPAGDYIDEAIKSEEMAIASYKEVLDYEGTCQFTDLQALLWHIYYDENEHLQNLKTTKIAYEAGDALAIG